MSRVGTYIENKCAYGIVWKAMDRKSREVIALKKIYDAFRNPTDAQRTFREIMFLQAFKDHPNIVRLYSIHRAINNQDIYLGFEYMETDLHNVIKRGNILKDIHKRYIMYQMLSATRYIHSGNVIHRDQKPSNVLLDSSCRAKIADFGLARSVNHKDNMDGEMEVDPTLTNYVATRWYRAPEILTASKKYTKCVDMWSLGCILGEMLRGKPLFQGNSTINQVEKIMAALPTPSQEDIISVCSGYGSALVSTQPTPDRSLHSLMEGYPEDARDLVESLIVLNPNHRLTASEALEHEYVRRFYRKSGEMIMPYNVVPPLRDDVQLSVDDYRNKLYEYINTGGGHLSTTPKISIRNQRLTISNQRMIPTAPQQPPPPTRQRSLILRPRREQAEYQTTLHRPQTVVKRSNTSMIDDNSMHMTQGRLTSSQAQQRQPTAKSAATTTYERNHKQGITPIRKSMSSKSSNTVHSEPKIYCKRRVDYTEGANMTPAAGDIGRMQHGFSQLNLATPISYPNASDDIQLTIDTQKLRQTITSGHQFPETVPSNHNLEPASRYSIRQKKYSSVSADEGQQYYQYKDYGVITESALHELTRNLRSGVR
ncbi:extracellular signal-regulated kinase 2-like [Ctenocephalides felis]|uniref:extracellular signal-regulated kinase 2-like n=1 Tax=Ctenocephalides felis TaxID=7515 RepID=UPI000E6E1451|nr:extracellular signal-regulated kinase 2-like [Ctenocephalides felis]